MLEVKVVHSQQLLSNETGPKQVMEKAYNKNIDESENSKIVKDNFILKPTSAALLRGIGCLNNHSFYVNSSDYIF